MTVPLTLAQSLSLLPIAIIATGTAVVFLVMHRLRLPICFGIMPIIATIAQIALVKVYIEYRAPLLTLEASQSNSTYATMMLILAVSTVFITIAQVLMAYQSEVEVE